ncbi:MAG TPA: hypothetical protein VJ787_00220 [Thermoleophilia bacterium]|nr:hypothetical protein [Thermoleophilia bacterium]
MSEVEVASEEAAALLEHGDVCRLRRVRVLYLGRMTTSFAEAFAPDALRAFAGERSFERGVAYTTRVKRLSEGEREAAATVRGTRTYRVRLWLEDDTPMFSCTCPVAADGRFCKHCVAVGLAASESGAVNTDARRRTATDDVRLYLDGLDKTRLVDLIVAQADDDELLRARLEVEAARARGQSSDLVDLDHYRHVIRHVMNPRGFVDYRSMYDYTRGIGDVIDSLEDLLATGFAAQVVDLCEHALVCLEDALDSVDDSDGQMTDIRDRLYDLHHAACVASRPDPVALAERLCDWEQQSDWETFFGAAATYADVLGQTGLAAYRRRAEELWARTPSLAPGDQGDHPLGRFAIAHVMETLAELSGDIDELVAVKARDLSSPYSFVEIAEVYRSAGRFDEALAWAERGAAAYPECADVRLLEILADEYERCGRGEVAVSLMWSLLESRPVLDSFQRLKAHVIKGGDWEAWRTKALDCLRNAATASRAAPRLDDMPTRVHTPGLTSSRILLGIGWSAGRSEVVRALLWEEDADAAWEEAVAGGCSVPLWMELAAARAVDHPHDALPVYVQQVERLIDQKNRRGYEEAVDLMRTIGHLMDRLGKGDEFPEYLAAVRAKHKQKRSLVRLLDAADWRHGMGRASKPATSGAEEGTTSDAT